MGRCIVDALLTVDPRLGLAAWWRRRPADDGAGRRRLVFLCGGESREVEGRYMGAVASPAMGGPVHSLYCTGCWVTLHS